MGARDRTCRCVDAVRFVAGRTRSVHRAMEMPSTPLRRAFCTGGKLRLRRCEAARDCLRSVPMETENAEAFVERLVLLVSELPPTT